MEDGRDHGESQFADHEATGFANGDVPDADEHHLPLRSQPRSDESLDSWSVAGQVEREHQDRHEFEHEANNAEEDAEESAGEIAGQTGDLSRGEIEAVGQLDRVDVGVEGLVDPFDDLQDEFG